MPQSYEELSAKVEVWLAPISEQSPSGADTASDPRLMAVKGEVKRIGSPTAGPPNWEVVLESGADILEHSSKDLIAGVAIACALQMTQGEPGLTAGLHLVAGLIEGFWTSLYPTRPETRKSYITWLIDRTSRALSQVPALDHPGHVRLSAAAARLNKVIGEKLGRDAPSIRPLREELERLAPPSEPTPEPEPVAAKPSAPSPVTVAEGPRPPAPVAEPVPAPPARAVALGEPQGGAPMTVREVGAALMQAAHQARRANLADAAAYRLLRVGRWLHVAAPPAAASPGERTAIPRLPKDRREALERLAREGTESASRSLIELSETLFESNTFSLDLHRFSAEALGRLGGAHTQARRAIELEVAGFLRRLPGLPGILDAEGLPLADEQTLRWIAVEASSAEPGARSAGALSASAPPPEPKADGAPPREVAHAVSDAAREPPPGAPLSEVFAHLQAQADAARSGDVRFRARLALAAAALHGAKLDLALGIYETLEAECSERRLDDWDPALTSSTLRGYIECLRAIERRGKNPSLESARLILFRRLCKVDPTAALGVSA